MSGDKNIGKAKRGRLYHTSTCVCIHGTPRCPINAALTTLAHASNGKKLARGGAGAAEIAAPLLPGCDQTICDMKTGHTPKKRFLARPRSVHVRRSDRKLSQKQQLTCSRRAQAHATRANRHENTHTHRKHVAFLLYPPRPTYFHWSAG